MKRCKICKQPLGTEYMAGGKLNRERVSYFYICHRHGLTLINTQQRQQDHKLLPG